jgi:sugar (pentulose or hexulose) kinase
MLLDRRTGDWCVALLDAIGIPLDKLPTIRGSSEIAGGVTPAAAAMTGLVAGTPVVLGGGDTTTTRIGANAEGTGRACLYLGTAAWLATPKRLAGRLVATATTGAALRWLVALLDGGQPDAPWVGYRALLAQAASAPPGAGGLLFLPHLMGERGPVYNPAAKGVLFGLTLAHGRAEVARAVLEGCAFHIRSILDTLSDHRLEEITVVGGGAKSALWSRIIASVTGLKVLVPAVPEAGALGAAILAGVGIGVYESAPAAAADLVRIVARYGPDPEERRLYDQMYDVYLDLEAQMTALYGRVPVAEPERSEL